MINAQVKPSDSAANHQGRDKAGLEKSNLSSVQAAVSTPTGKVQEGYERVSVSSRRNREAAGQDAAEHPGGHSTSVLVPGSKLKIMIEGRPRDAVVNAQGGLELAPEQFYIGSLRGASLSPPRDYEVPPPPPGTPPRTLG